MFGRKDKPVWLTARSPFVRDGVKLVRGSQFQVTGTDADLEARTLVAKGVAVMGRQALLDLSPVPGVEQPEALNQIALEHQERERKRRADALARDESLRADFRNALIPEIDSDVDRDRTLQIRQAARQQAASRSPWSSAGTGSRYA